MRALWAQAQAEIAMTLRRGESVLLTIGIPVLLLVFFELIGFPNQVPGRTIDFLTPGILALAVMSTSMVSLGIATGFERQYGVLKRLRTTPLGRPSLLMAKTLAIVVVEILQVVVLGVIGAALGWQLRGNAALAVAAMALATVAFSGLGLLMAGTLRAEMTLALANGLYIVLLLLGGMVIPLHQLPGGLQAIAHALPAAALSSALDHTLAGSGTLRAGDWAVLVAWAIAAPAAAAWLFKWE
jgi:ABC-2 type transport system permease protein